MLRTMYDPGQRSREAASGRRWEGRLANPMEGRSLFFLKTKTELKQEKTEGRMGSWQE